MLRGYRDKYGMEMPTSKLARIIYDENKLLFNSVEQVRDKLRYIEGKHGVRERKCVHEILNFLCQR